MESAAECERRLKSAIASGQYATARAELPRWSRALAASIETSDPASAAELLRHAAATLERLRHVMLCEREHIRGDLAALLPASAYARSTQGQHRHLRLNA